MLIKPLTNATPAPFRHTWEGLANVDQFRWLVRADMQDQLALARRELGTRHVRAVGMLDDEMRVMTPDPTRWRDTNKFSPEPNWQMVTHVVERLLGIGINPMITTCFMPTALAAGAKTVFETKSNISLPTDWAEWRKLVRSLAAHLVRHFGAEVVRDFYFEVWNEPNLQDGFFAGTRNDFFRLYRETVSEIKSVDAALRVGGPSTARAEWIPEFLEFCRAENIGPDYLVGHVYNNDSDSKPLSPFDGPQEDLVSKSPNFAAGVIRGTRRLLDTAGFRGEVHWNEWGRSWFPCEPARESANEAAFIVKTMAEVSQCADRFAYWCLSDIYNQAGYGNSAFHGNYGLLSLHGLRKPGYLAHQLLGRLGGARIPVECEGADALNNAVATLGENGGSVLVYRYSAEDSPSVERGRVVVEMPAGWRPAALFRVTSAENNILHAWREAGAPKYLRTDALAALKSQNTLAATTAFTFDGTRVAFELERPGIALLEMNGARLS